MDDKWFQARIEAKIEQFKAGLRREYHLPGQHDQETHGDWAGVNNEPPQSAAEAKAALVKGMLLYRGVRARAEGSAFASDPGDFGRGVYYTSVLARARAHAPKNVGADLIALKNPLVLGMDEAYDLATRYGTVDYKHGVDGRLAGAQRLTTDLMAKGYDGLVAMRKDRKTGRVTELEVVVFKGLA